MERFVELLERFMKDERLDAAEMDELEAFLVRKLDLVRKEK
jgi:hypothetical protein